MSAKHLLDDAMTPIERVRLALAMEDAGYKIEFCSGDIEELLKAYDFQVNKAHLPVSPENINALRERIARALVKAHYRGFFTNVADAANLVRLVDTHWGKFIKVAEELMLP